MQTQIFSQVSSLGSRQTAIMFQRLKRRPPNSNRGVAVQEINMDVWWRMIIREHADLQTVGFGKWASRTET
jgi:hypothetical protein